MDFRHERLNLEHVIKFGPKGEKALMFSLNQVYFGAGEDAATRQGKHLPGAPSYDGPQ